MEGFEWALRVAKKGKDDHLKSPAVNSFHGITSSFPKSTPGRERHIPPRDLETCGHLSRIQIAKHFPWQELPVYLLLVLPTSLKRKHLEERMLSSNNH